jgi:phosphonate transport system ATP-binding protein
VASLHHVELALAHFPRVVGLRDGRLQFDLPAAQVTPARLQALYAQHEHELLEPAAASRAPCPAPAAVPMMHCR